MLTRSRLVILHCAIALWFGTRLFAADHYGQVTFGGLPVPGASVTASQGDRKVVTSSDQQGVYKLEDLTDGVWTISVAMIGFSTSSRDVTITGDGSSSTWELTLLPFAEIARGIETPAANQGRQKPDTNPVQQTPAPAGNTRGFQRAGVNATAPIPPPARTDAPGFPEQTGVEAAMGAADGFLINGSVNNGAASPFAQLRAFGNSRPGQRSLYNGGVGLVAGNSAFDARPFSFSGQPTSKAAYNDTHIIGSFGGPLRIPGLVRNGANLFVGYQRTEDHNASTQSALLPTLLERNGDFSQTRDALGRPVQGIDPSTGAPFAGNLIRRDRISPQAAALLAYYPQPNTDAAGRYNYQTPVLGVTRQDAVQSRATQPINTRNQLSGTFAYQRTTTDTT